VGFERTLIPYATEGGGTSGALNRKSREPNNNQPDEEAENKGAIDNRRVRLSLHASLTTGVTGESRFANTVLRSSMISRGSTMSEQSYGADAADMCSGAVNVVDVAVAFTVGGVACVVAGERAADGDCGRTGGSA
jgi:hypothetical protein